MFEDFWAFRSETIRQWVAVSIRAIGREDPHRPIFSNRFARGAEADWLDLIELFAPYNGIATNLYPANRVPGLSPDERACLTILHERTGKPVLVTEWSIPALDSRLYDADRKLDWSFAKAVGTQVERAHQAAKVQIDLANLPFVIGSHWFIWRDIDRQDRRSNRGLTQANGEPWQQLQNALQTANERIAEAINGLLMWSGLPSSVRPATSPC